MALSILPAYRKAKKEELPKPERRWVDYMPHEQIGEMVVIAAIFGILGAKIFDFLQPDRIQDFFQKCDRFIEQSISLCQRSDSLWWIDIWRARYFGFCLPSKKFT